MKIYKFIPLVITLLVGVILFLNPTEGSVVYMMLNPTKFPSMSIKSNLLSLGLYVILPTVIIIILGTTSIEKFKQGKKSSFMTWVFLFIVWLCWLLMLTRFVPLIDPLRAIL
jgi:fatty acid desaturase